MSSGLLEVHNTLFVKKQNGLELHIIKNVYKLLLQKEPVVYMNGQSFTPRLRENMNENMEFPGATGEYIEWLQDSFAKTIKEVVEKDKNDPFVKREERGKVIHSLTAVPHFKKNWF